jgi:phosphomevalonate kinase
VAVFGDSEFYGSSNGKTGLGSSSAMTVAVIESVAKFLAEGDLPKVQIFKMAAIAHSLAQGNIGSCFDVSCAVWGSQRFRRPNPCFLELGRINEDWDNEFVPFSLPGHLRICVLRTPFLGSSTPGLVKRFLENAEREKKLVNDLKDAVEPASLALLSGDFAAIRDKFRRVRRVLRQITEQWRLEIVPDEVNELADHLEEVEGVIAAVIPGAGGYDSLAVIAQQGSELDFGNLSVEILAQTDESSENP